MRRAASRYSRARPRRSPASSSRCARTASQAVVPGHARRRRRASRAGPARPAGRRTIATATARLSVTIGLGGDALEQLVERDDLAPVGVLGARRPRRGRRRSRPAAGTARAAVRASASLTSATPSLDRRRVPARAVLLGERDERAVGRRCAPAGARRSAASARAGPRPRRRPGSGRCTSRVSRIASRVSVGALQVGAGARRVALVEDQVEHVQHRARAVARARRSGGSANGVPAALIVSFARLIRCAIVASGTRNARAISAVVRPPTARSVSAICEARESAGWQHRNSRVERVVLRRARRRAGRGSDGRPGRRPPPRAGAARSRCAAGRSAGARRR